MKKVSPLNYTFAVGKIRALERYLIRQEVFEEAIDSSLSEVLRLFVEANLYGDELLHIKDSEQLEVLLHQEIVRLKNMVKGLLLDKKLSALLELDTIRCAEEVMKGYPSQFLGDFLRHLIDMHNIKTFLRLRILKEPKEVLEINLVCEGFIKKKDLIRLFDEELAIFVNRLEYVHKHKQVIDYASFLRDAIERLEKELSFIMLEKAVNDFIISCLEPAKYITFGPEPVLAYYFAKRNEIDLIRMVILAKLNEVSVDLIKERLNIVYA